MYMIAWIELYGFVLDINGVELILLTHIIKI